MNSALSLKIKLLLALTVGFLMAADASAQSLRKIDLGANKPRARSSHTLINVKGRVFMFGGFNAALPPDNDFAAADSFSPQNIFGKLDGIFEFNKQMEKFIQSPGPAGQVALANTASSVVSETGEIFSFFGLSRDQNDFSMNTDVHTYNPFSNTWKKQAQTDGPVERQDPGILNIFLSPLMFIFGGVGKDGKPLDDAWKYDFFSDTYTQLPSMPEAIAPTDVFPTIFGQIVVIGINANLDPVGFTYNPLSNTWRRIPDSDLSPNLSIAQADETPAQLLSRRFSASAVAGNTLYLFGGRSKTNQSLDDIIKVVAKEDGTFSVERLSPKFPAGFTHSRAVVLSITPIAGFQSAGLQTVEILIYGGIVGGQEVSDAYIFTDTVEVATPPDECTGGPTVKSITVGGKTKIKGNGFLDGLTLQINGISFNKSPSITPNKVTQKGSLANGQTAVEACATGCEFKITNGDGKCTKVSVP